MAYRADIEIAVQGTTQLTNLRSQLNSVSATINKLNKELISRNVVASSIKNLTSISSEASRAMREAATGTRAQKQAIDVYIKSVDAAERAEAKLQIAITRRRRELGLATKEVTKATAANNKFNLGKAVGGRVSSAAVGGAFPLLFGQSPQAAVGGALGGLLGGPGAGGFAGSLIGTALGELVAAQDRIKELGLELGFSATQTTELAKAFELAGKNSEQLQAAVTNIQGLGLSTEETASAIKISSELAQEYGGKVDKIAQAFANTLESGKVSISTLNAFTAQGLPIQDELAKKLNVSKTTLLEMAKDGKVAVQDVIDVLVDMGRAAEKTADNSRTGFDEFTSSVKELATAIADAAGVLLKTLVPALDTVLTKLASIITDATRAISLLTDVQVGGLAKAISSSSGFRSTGFSSKTNIDAITRELKALNPALAQNSNDIVKYRKVLENARVELSKYNGQLGEYSVNTAQRALSAAQVALNARERALPKEPLSTPIKGITAPTQLSPSGKGDTSRDKAADNLRRAQNFLRALEQQSALLETQTKLDEEILKISQEYEENLLKISEQEDQSLRTAQEDAALRIRNQQINDVVEKQEKKRLESLDKQLEKYKKIDAVRKIAYEGYAKAEVVNLQELTLQAEILKAAFENIGRSFSSSVAEVVGGTKTIKEAVADMFGALGRALIEYATQAIATYIAIGIARIFAGVSGVEQANYTGNEMGGAFINPSFGVDSSGLAGPSSAFSSLDYAGVKFAEGGFVTGPTSAVVGEGGEPEYIIPASKMRAAMGRYASGARGPGVIPQNGDSMAAGGGGGGTFTLETVVINNVEYATVDQVRAMGQQAAAKGAEGGYTKSMRTLQNSRSQRSKLGIGR